MVRHGDTIVEDEVWTFPGKIGAIEAKEMAQAIFSDCYDLMNFVVHGGND